MKKILFLALMLALTPAMATNKPPANECGNHGNNCGGDNGGQGGAGGNGVGIGVGVGVGHGGNATATGGAGGSGGNAYGAGGDGGNAAVVGSGNSSNLNNNKAEGGTGIGFGGNAKQGQDQLQGQAQSSKNTNIQGQAVDASSRNDNTSSAAGNTTDVNIGGDTYVQKRNAPGIVAGSVFPTASCKSGFGIGGSGPAGGGLLNIATTDKECQVVVLSQNFSAIGRDETACLLLKTTKTWERSVKKNPALAELDCAPKPAPVAPALPPVSYLIPQTPRG